MEKKVICRNCGLDARELKADEIIENEDGVFCKYCLDAGRPSNVVIYER